MRLASIAADYLRRFLVYTKEAYGIKGKLVILAYFLKTPLFLIYYIAGRNHGTSLLADVIVKNRNGKYFCDRNIWIVHTASTLCEKDVDSYMALEAGTFIDVGANVGKYTVKLGNMLKNTGKVIALEPEDFNFSILQKNIKLNALLNTKIIKKGAYSKKAALKFHVDKENMGTHSLVKTGSNSKTVKIEVDTIDNICRDEKAKDVRLIKIDVEGAELEVLKGATKILKANHPKIIIEAWDQIHFKKIQAFLKQYGYTVKRINEENYIFE